MIKTVNLEMAKLLKEAGFPQNSHYYWVHIFSPKNPMEAKLDTWTLFPFDWNHVKEVGISAPTTDELLEEITYCNDDNSRDRQKFLMDIYRDPNKLAQCWLWLNSQGLLG